MVRLAVPLQLSRAYSLVVSHSALARQSSGYAQADLRPHIIRFGNTGRFATGIDDVRNIIQHNLPPLTAGLKEKLILLYARRIGARAGRRAVRRR